MYFRKFYLDQKSLKTADPRVGRYARRGEKFRVRAGVKGVVVENQTSFDKISAKFFQKNFFFLTENGFKRVEIMWATWSEKNILSKNCRNLVSKWS